MFLRKRPHIAVGEASKEYAVRLRRIRFTLYCCALLFLGWLLSPSSWRPPTSAEMGWTGRRGGPPTPPPPVSARPYVSFEPTLGNSSFFLKTSINTDAGKIEENPIYSAAHCWGSNMVPKEEWRTTGCHVKNMCFNYTSKEFVYFSNGEDKNIMDLVSITVINFRWKQQYDNSIKFRPRIVNGPLPSTRYQAPSSDQYVLHLGFVPNNPGHLLWDDYWTWFMLSASVMSEFTSRSMVLRPVWVNENKDPPWATCDWIRQHSGPGHALRTIDALRCEGINFKWLSHMLGPGQTRPSETNFWISDFPRSVKDVDMFCLPSAVVGSGATSRNQGGHDGWNPGDVLPPTAGRGPLMFDFRRHILRRSGLVDFEPSQRKTLKVTFALSTSSRLPFPFESLKTIATKHVKALSLIAQQVSGRPDLMVEVIAKELPRLTPADQLKLMLETAVFVGVAGGGAMSAHFLPPGSGSILVYTNHDIHQGRDDWKIFGMASWQRVEFINSNIDLMERSAQETIFMKILREQVAASAAFMF